MCKLLLKQFAIIILIILAVLSIVFGAVLPWGKSQLYIDALTDMQSGKTYTTEQFESKMGNIFDFYSPIGQEEIVKFFGSDILSVVSQRDFPESASQFLVGYIEKYLFKNNVRHLIIGGVSYKYLWHRFGSEEDFKKSEEYFKKAQSIGPKLPPVLYDLFELYRLRGDSENIKKIGEEILKYWPGDENVKSIINAATNTTLSVE